MEKSVSKMWRESGSTLSFKQWVERENQKKDSYQNFVVDTSSIDTLLAQQQKVIDSNAGIKTPASASKNVLGLDTRVLAFSSILIFGSLGVYFYRKFKKK